MKYFVTATFLISALFILGCEQDRLGQAPIPDSYETMVAEWEQNRVETLKEPTGWMRLAGMFWLNEGENSFGSGTDQDIRFPEGAIAEHAGYFVVEGGEVSIRVADEVEISADGNRVTEQLIYDGDEAVDLEHGTLEFLVIEREGELAIRLFNKENEKVDNFDGFPRYPLDPEWRLKAKFIPNTDEKTISIVNVLGQNIDAPSPGTVEFEVDGEQYSIDALEGSERLFLIVADETNQTETYQAGRYIYIDYPEEGSNYTVIDFNKIYNPPCAYNLYTTCQLPPQQNRLDLAIEAGEKRPVDWDGL